MLLSLPPMRVGEIHSRHCRNRDLRNFTPQWPAGSHFCHDSPGAAGRRGVHERHPRGVEGWVPQAPQEFVGELLGGEGHDQPCRVPQDVEEKQRCRPFLGEKGNSEVILCGDDAVGFSFYVFRSALLWCGTLTPHSLSCFIQTQFLCRLGIKDHCLRDGNNDRGGKLGLNDFIT